MSVPRQAVVLAAGEGRRLRPLTRRLPKPLVPFLNRPLLEHVLGGLSRAGVRHVALNAWHEAGQLQAFAASDPVPGLALSVRVEQELLGTGGGLRNLLDLLEPGPLLVTSADVLAPFDLERLAEQHEARGALASMALVTAADTRRYGAVEMDASGHLTDILGRLGRPGQRAAVNGSLHLFERAFLEALPSGPCCLVRDGYLPALSRGARCAAFLHDGPWHELGTPEGLLAAQRAALTGSLPVDPGLLRRGGERRGDCLVHSTARVSPRARLLHGTVVGPGAQIGPLALLDGCLVLADAVVPGGASHRGRILGQAAGEGSRALPEPDPAHPRGAPRGSA